MLKEEFTGVQFCLRIFWVNYKFVFFSLKVKIWLTEQLFSNPCVYRSVKNIQKEFKTMVQNPKIEISKPKPKPPTLETKVRPNHHGANIEKSLRFPESWKDIYTSITNEQLNLQMKSVQ